MFTADVSLLGTLLIGLILVVAAYTFAMALAASRRGTRFLRATHYGMFATMGSVAAAVFLLAYAFQANDFRLRYVARYSDRSMPWYYLWTALWGGQDGSLLWWTFILSIYSLLFTLWIRRRYVHLQPFAFATLSTIYMFFGVLMLFAANPFAPMHSPPADGEGLNPLLQNYWMTIHPPALYMGLVGWSVPFAIASSALLTGRLGDDWIRAARRWVLLAWAFLSLGNMLGMFWSYEELGWGGYWAWDPVENASFMPWLTGTAYLHSTMIQERRGMLKVWNVFLLCLTFFLTIFGTFLTRSGLISSVHSFARSDIGVYFIWYMAALALYIFGMIIWRLPKLKPRARLDSLLSREFAFTLNNWILVGMLAFIMVATTFPLISEWLYDQEVTVGASYYNKWMVPLGLILLFLAGIGPLISWRKATGSSLWRAFRWPLLVGGLAAAVHVMFGAQVGFPPRLASDDVHHGPLNQLLATLYETSPLTAIALSAFVVATIVQEFARGVNARRRAKGESVPIALVRLVSKARRRYGGYTVHLGIVVMYLGFTGAAYDLEHEATLRQGDTLPVGDYSLRFDRARTEVDPNKRMLFADLSVYKDGQRIDTVSPAKFIYRTHPEMPTTEVAIRSTPLRDLYVILSGFEQGTAQNGSQSKVTIRALLRPLVAWIWFGGALIILGVFISAFPSIRELIGEVEPQVGVAAAAGKA